EAGLRLAAAAAMGDQREPIARRERNSVSVTDGVGAVQLADHADFSRAGAAVALDRRSVLRTPAPPPSEVEASRRMAELAHMNRSAAIGQMSASIAHEIKQPLAAIVMNAGAGLRWLAKDTPNLEQAAHALKNIVGNGNRASQVVETIRAMFKKEMS